MCRALLFRSSGVHLQKRSTLLLFLFLFFVKNLLILYSFPAHENHMNDINQYEDIFVRRFIKLYK